MRQSFEFLTSCERELEHIGNQLTDQEKIEFITKHFQDSAAKWFTIVPENIHTYEQFKSRLKRDTGTYIHKGKLETNWSMDIFKRVVS